MINLHISYNLLPHSEPIERNALCPDCTVVRFWDS